MLLSGIKEESIFWNSDKERTIDTIMSLNESIRTRLRSNKDSIGQKATYIDDQGRIKVRNNKTRRKHKFRQILDQGY